MRKAKWEMQKNKRDRRESRLQSQSDVLLTFISLLLWNLNLFPDDINYPIFQL